MKTLGILLAAITCGAALQAETISTAEAFVAKLTANPAGDYKLSANIDLTDAGYETIANFTGILDGRGHTITGLGAKSLFVTNAGSVVSLTLDGRDADGNVTTNKAQLVGCFAIVSTNAFYSDCKIAGYNLRSNGQYSCLGLFSSYAYDGTHFVRCETDASCAVVQDGRDVHSDFGGMVGIVTRTDGTATDVASFVDCTNRSEIACLVQYRSGYGAGGIVGKILEISASDAPYPEVNFIRCVNLGGIVSSATMGAMGGIVGLGYCACADAGKYDTASTIRFLYCENRGDLTSLSETDWSDGIGGILGTGNGTFDGILIGCVNYGAIRVNALKNSDSCLVGGLVAATGSPYVSRLSGRGIWRFENCANYGSLTVATSGRIGGICGYNTSNPGHNTGKHFYENCANYGTITSPVAFGAIVGDINVGNGNNTCAVFSNCWVAAGSLYTNCSTTVTIENFFAADADDYDAANALAALNAMAATDDGYLPWAMGTGDDAKPELSLFSDVALSDGIPVLFYDYDGTLLQSSTVEACGSVTPPTKPSRSGWYFVDWSGTYKNVTATSIVFADWTRIKKQTGFRLIIR